MSKIVVHLPQEPLRWWHMRLECNEDQHLMVQHYDNLDNPTKVVSEFFDGSDAVLEDAIQVATERVGSGMYLHVLSRHRPTSSQEWKPGQPIRLPDPNWRDRQNYTDSLSRY